MGKKHSCRQMSSMLKEAQDNYNCRIVIKRKSGSIIVYPPNSKLVVTFHIGEKGIHPLRRFINSLEKTK